MSLRGGLAIKPEGIKLTLPSGHQELSNDLCTLTGLLANGGTRKDINAVLAPLNDALAKGVITLK